MTPPNSDHYVVGGMAAPVEIQTCDLVELPVTWGLDDFPAFEYVSRHNAGLSSPPLAEIWKGDFGYAHARCPGGAFNLTTHPQAIGRGHRMLTLEGLIDHFRGHEGVIFETLGDYTECWKSNNPTEEWNAATPLYTGDSGTTPARRSE